MSVDNILQRLNKVRKTGPNKWIACCPAHEDKHPSFSVLETDDGRVLIHCFGGCSTSEVLDALGMDCSDLFPAKPMNGHSYKPLRNPWSNGDALMGLQYESLVLLQFANHINAGNRLTADQHSRLALTVARIQRASGAAR